MIRLHVICHNILLDPAVLFLALPALLFRVLSGVGKYNKTVHFGNITLWINHFLLFSALPWPGFEWTKVMACFVKL